MYVPAAFVESDLAKLHDFIEQNSFGTIVSQVNGSPFASHLPLILERSTGVNGILFGHMARANPQWQEAGGQTALAIFSGPHAYVSPTWYEDEHVVPTWNFTAVHAYGQIEIVDDEEAVLTIVQKSVAVYERNMPRPWSFDDADVFIRRMLTQIVGFRMEIKQIEGKWKLNQNQTSERRARVVRALQQQNDENSQAIAAMMQAPQPES